MLVTKDIQTNAIGKYIEERRNGFSTFRLYVSEQLPLTTETTLQFPVENAKISVTSDGMYFIAPATGDESGSHVFYHKVETYFPMDTPTIDLLEGENNPDGEEIAYWVLNKGKWRVDGTSTGKRAVGYYNSTESTIHLRVSYTGKQYSNKSMDIEIGADGSETAITTDDDLTEGLV